MFPLEGSAAKLVIDLLGWIGALSYLTAYYLVSNRRLEGDSLPYQLMNLLGGVFLTGNALFYHALPSVGVNVVWIGISMAALIRLWSRRRKT